MPLVDLIQERWTRKDFPGGNVLSVGVHPNWIYYFSIEGSIDTTRNLREGIDSELSEIGKSFSILQKADFDISNTLRENKNPEIHRNPKLFEKAKLTQHYIDSILSFSSMCSALREALYIKFLATEGRPLMFVFSPAIESQEGIAYWGLIGGLIGGKKIPYIVSRMNNCGTVFPSAWEDKNYSPEWFTLKALSTGFDYAEFFGSQLNGCMIGGVGSFASTGFKRKTTLIDVSTLHGIFLYRAFNRYREDSELENFGEERYAKIVAEVDSIFQLKEDLSDLPKLRGKSFEEQLAGLEKHITLIVHLDRLIGHLAIYHSERSLERVSNENLLNTVHTPVGYGTKHSRG